MTNAHVIDGANTVKVRLADDREYRAKVVGKDDRLDVAVLELESAPHDLPVGSLGASDALRVGTHPPAARDSAAACRIWGDADVAAQHVLIVSGGPPF